MITHWSAFPNPEDVVVSLDDGSALLSWGYKGLKVIYENPCPQPIPADGTFVAVTGVLGAEGEQIGELTYPVPVLRVPCYPGDWACIIRVDLRTGDDRYDGSSWVYPKKTIQAGIDAAEEGCEVWVAGDADHVYHERITMKNAVSVYGGFAGTETAREQRNWETNETIIDGDQGGSVVTISEISDPTTIDGFTIRNGKADTGGGIYCISSAVTISHNKIKLNTADRFGGGISVGGQYGVTSPTIRYNAITENTAGANGGGIHCNNSEALISDNLAISQNTALGECGGGIYYEGSYAPAIRDNTIAGNVADRYGGGICGITAYTTTRNEISGNTVDGNRCTSVLGEGGGIFCKWNSPTINSNTIKSNDAGDHGAGVALEISSAVLLNNLVLSNHVTDSYARGGGGLQVWASYPAGTPVVAINNTFVGNDAGAGRGGAVLVRCDEPCSTSHVVLINNIFHTNTCAYSTGKSVACIDGGTADVSYCAAYPGNAGNVGEHYYNYDAPGPLTLGAGCAFVPVADPEPLFQNAAGGNYQLRITLPGGGYSPCIDAALNPDQFPQYEQWLVFDRAGSGRPVDVQGVGNPATSSAYADMGAYENQQTQP